MDYIASLWGIFNWVLASSAMASVLAGLILLVKFVFKHRLGVNWHYLIWFLLVIRLIMPWAPASSFSIYNLFPSEKQGTAPVSGEVLHEDKGTAKSRFSESGGVSNPGKGNNLATVTAGLPNTTDQGVAYQDKPPVTSEILFGAWLLGMVAVAFYTVVVNRRFALKIRGQSSVTEQKVVQAFENSKRKIGIRAKIPLMETAGIRCPTLYGLVKPRVLLPIGVAETLSREQLNHVFLHELVHYKRKDIAVNWLMSVLLILHWFNPLLWYAFYRMREDQEIACDAFALSRINPDESKEYAYTIIKLLEGMAETPRLASLASVSGTKSQLARRITMIKLFKKNTLRWSLLGMGVLVLIAGLALTNAKGGTPDQGALDKAVSHKVDLLYGKLQVDLPASWGLKAEHETEVKFTFGEGHDRGGIRIVGFYQNQPQGGWRPNHSSDISEEIITTPVGKGELAVLEMSNPAASGNDATWQEIHAVIPMKNQDLAYDFWLKADQSVEQDTLLLKQMLNEVKSITDDQGKEAEGDEAAVTKLVEDFGRKLQTVSLQAPQDIVNKSMQENYGDFVSPELLEEWVNDPQNAPGRVLSSPWPDRIDILSIRPLPENAYEVKGEIIEITSVEKVSGGVAARRPITLVAKKIGNRWLIDAATLGPYGEANSIVYKNTQYGFNFSLPASWKGYSIVTGKWEGYTPGGPEGNQIVETGPMVSIRHPQWTAENPRQDIPIMVFTFDQWNSLQQGKFYISAAPVGPSELGRNTKYVFALPARYNHAFPTGFEEVEKILASNPLRGAVSALASPGPNGSTTMAGQ